MSLLAELVKSGFGIGVAIGILFGIPLVAWFKPTTISGNLLIILIAILLGYLIQYIIRIWLAKR